MRTLACITVLSALLSLTASASEITHDWTVRIDGHEYGLQGLKEYTPPYHRTMICYSSTWPSFRIVDLHIYTFTSIVLVIGSIPPLVTAFYYARHRRRHRNAA
jgi:hypothetical protein